MRKETGPLHSVADLSPQFGQSVIVDRFAVNMHRTGTGPYKAVDELEQSRFATAARSDNGSGDAVHKCDGHITQGCFLDVDFAHVLEQDFWHMGQESIVRGLILAYNEVRNVEEATIVGLYVFEPKATCQGSPVEFSIF